jgi:UDP-N-acetyl-D-galactosamine dehydrogenase
LNIDTHAVLEAAGTKWNFLPFKPGLVGGHCIGVDPYYLAQKAQEMGYHPEIILAGRRLNDSMGEYVAAQIVKLMIKKGISVNGATLLMLGITFKENCPDVRNTKIVDVIAALTDYGITVTTYDPLANPAEVHQEYKLKTATAVPHDKFDAVVLGVAHAAFLNLDFSQLQNEKSVLYDVKGVLGNKVDGRL